MFSPLTLYQGQEIHSYSFIVENSFFLPLATHVGGFKNIQEEDYVKLWEFKKECTDDKNLERLFSFALFLFANKTDHLISINSDLLLYCQQFIHFIVRRCKNSCTKVRPVDTTANSNSMHIYGTEKVEGD